MFVKSTTPKMDQGTGFDAYAMIKDTNADNRRAAAIALSGQKEAFAELADLSRSETETPVRDAVLNALIAIGSAKVVDLYIEHLRADDATLRREAVYALQHLPKKAAKKIRKLMSDQDPDVRIMAVDILQLLTISDAVEWIRDLLANEDNANVVGVAVDRLSEIGGPQDVGILKQVKDRFSSDAYVQFAATHAIDRIIALEAEEPS
ncbi:hypothetical protein BVC71_03725 [Marivivens niveibacter]|uniref:PBS lyase n=1 Tax=Marivivens niveibacter TaxID=1930667 RepID=A0A251X213_9RHOB|nr:HEAT repeat domain-containing protein [Marivivens niveibacter]OUD10611.1 hypothetical protein BVC71_03725 [Marivivens niveibacter]